MNVIELLREWQTLVAGMMALLGGLFVVLQTAEIRQQERQRLRRRHAAARAVMPLALSTTCEYTKNCAGVLRKILSSANRNTIPTSPSYPSFPDFPGGVVTEFAAAIESSNQEAASALSELLREMQIFSSRLRSLSSNLASESCIIGVHNLESNIADAAELYARAEALFDYARAKTEEVSTAAPSVERILSALMIFSLDNTSKNLFDMINRRYEEKSALPSPKLGFAARLARPILARFRSTKRPPPRPARSLG